MKYRIVSQDFDGTLGKWTSYYLQEKDFLFWHTVESTMHYATVLFWEKNILNKLKGKI
jgi:hypothetical protein